MALQVGVLALVAADQAVKAINDGVQQLDQGQANYIRDGDPQSIPGVIGLAVARSACRRYAEGDIGLSPEASAGYELACRPYLDAIQYGTPPALTKPFDGGQCEGIRYTAFWTTVAGSGATVEGQDPGLVGPVGAFFITEEPPFYWINIPSTGGVARQILDSTSNPKPTIQNFRVVRQDGQPDNCGNPDPVVTDPVPPTGPGQPTPNPEPFNPEPGVDVDLDVTLNFDGSVNFNIGVGVPIVITPRFDFSPDGSGDGDGGEVPPGTGSPEPGPTNPGGNGGFGGDDEFGPPPAGRRWVGACLTITEKPDNSGIITGSQPEDVYPSVVGNVRLVISAGGNRQTDTPVRINAKKVCVWEPVDKLNPTGINVDLLPGFGYTYTPYSVPLTD